MKNSIFGKLFMGAMLLFAAVSFTACVDDNEDVGMPYLELDSEVLPFTLEGGEASFMVNTNRPWYITLGENSDWLTIDPMEGEGPTKVEILLPAATTGREATLNFHLANTYGVYLTKSMKIQQGEIAAAEVLWHENFGAPSQTDNGWPSVANYTGWEKGGLYGADVTYSAASEKATVRAASPTSVGYADASGAGKLFIGTGMPAFVVGNIQTGGAVNYTLNFGGAYFNYGTKDETFYADKCHIYVSGDNAKWSEVTYTTVEAEEGWVYATALFTLKEATDVLYVKLVVDEASRFSIDDMQLTSGGVGGQEIDLAAGSEGEGGTEDEEPTPGGDGSSDKTFPGAGKYLLLAKNEGAFVAATPSDKTSSYFYPAATAVTPANNALAADDTTNALAWTIVAASTEGQYTIAMPNNHYCYGTADHTSFNISSSVGTGGYTWTFTPHTDGSWKLLCVDYSKTLQYSSQYNSFGVYKEDADSYIYLYQLNAGGTAYELVGENASGGEGEEPTPDTPTDGTSTTITELIGMMGSETVTLDKDYVLEGVVLSDVEGGNYTGNNLVLQTEGSTTAKNGVVLYGSQVDPKALGLSRGDKVKVLLYQGKAQLKIYNDLYEITGAQSDTWCKVEKVGTGTVNPTVITLSQMKDFQSMLVTIKDVTASAAGTWCTADAAGNHTFTVGSSNLTVYVKKAAAAFAGKEFKATTGDMTGIVTMYNGAVQLAPRDLNDVAAFTEGGTTPEPEPEPDPTPDPGTGGGTDDFATLTNAMSYGEQTTTAGWKGVNCAVQSGGSNDSNPVFKSLLGESDQVKGLVINGKTTTIGVITSPTLTGGCGTLSFDYGYTFSESNGISFKVEIMQAGAVVKSFEVIDAAAVQLQKYSFSQEVGVTGDFQIVITNNCPSASSKNKDRYTIFNVKWTGKN